MLSMVRVLASSYKTSNQESPTFLSRERSITSILTRIWIEDTTQHSWSAAGCDSPEQHPRQMRISNIQARLAQLAPTHS